MSLRVRYTTLAEEGKFQSVKMFQHPTNGARYKVFLNTVDNEWMVVDDISDITAVSGRDVNLSRMKKAAKQALVELGVEFETEVGQRSEYRTKNKNQNVA